MMSVYKTFSDRLGEKLSFPSVCTAERFLAANAGKIIYLEIVADFPFLHAVIIKDSSTSTFFAKTCAGLHKLQYREVDGFLLAGVGSSDEKGKEELEELHKKGEKRKAAYWKGLEELRNKKGKPIK